MSLSLLNPPKDTSQHTFMGRFMHFQRVVDPRMFFASSAQLKEAIKHLEDTRKQEDSNGGPLRVSKSEYDRVSRA